VVRLTLRPLFPIMCTCTYNSKCRSIALWPAGIIEVVNVARTIWKVEDPWPMILLPLCITLYSNLITKSLSNSPVLVMRYAVLMLQLLQRLIRFLNTCFLIGYFKRNYVSLQRTQPSFVAENTLSVFLYLVSLSHWKWYKRTQEVKWD
jgi:hypothetical protein